MKNLLVTVLFFISASFAQAVYYESSGSDPHYESGGYYETYEGPYEGRYYEDPYYEGRYYGYEEFCDESLDWGCVSDESYDESNGSYNDDSDGYYDWP